MKRALLLAVLLTGCGGGDDAPSILPTVQSQVGCLEAALAGTITCHDWQGVQPDREVQPARVNNRPDYCFLGDECFYDCPHKAGG